jgi:hypothetical protein
VVRSARKSAPFGCDWGGSVRPDTGEVVAATEVPEAGAQLTSVFWQMSATRQNPIPAASYPSCKCFARSGKSVNWLPRERFAAGETNDVFSGRQNRVVLTPVAGAKLAEAKSNPTGFDQP